MVNNNNLPTSGLVHETTTGTAAGNNRNNNVGSSNEEEFPVYTLLQHSSDTQVSIKCMYFYFYYVYVLNFRVHVLWEVFVWFIHIFTQHTLILHHYIFPNTIVGEAYRG